MRRIHSHFAGATAKARRRARRGAIITRSNGERYRIDGSGRLSGELYRVIVTEEPGRA